MTTDPRFYTTEEMTNPKELEKEINAMKETFSLLDAYGTGAIAIEDMGLVIRSLGHYPSEAQIRDLQQAAGESDENDTGRVSFPEFLSLYTSFKKLIPTNVNHVNDMKAAFQTLYGGKTIPVDHLRRILSNCGEQLEDEEVDEILEDADVDEHGNVNYEDFIRNFVNRRGT